MSRALCGHSCLHGSEGAVRREAGLAELERAHIEEVLSRCDGNVTRAASALGIDRRTLQRKLKGLRALPR